MAAPPLTCFIFRKQVLVGRTLEEILTEVEKWVWAYIATITITSIIAVFSRWSGGIEATDFSSIALVLAVILMAAGGVIAYVGFLGLGLFFIVLGFGLLLIAIGTLPQSQ